LAERCARAIRLTAPKIAARTPGLAVAGRWLTDDSYHFLSEPFEPSIDRTGPKS
jgi:hypothetical protein